MRLKALRLFGFKTFAEQTTVEFEPGITAVVGPNGSGKSNLVDAIRWVLGEQSTRSLRSQRLEDVIFAGNATRKPLGMAEVSVTFDNGDRQLPLDFNEVQITRRAYRAGESEYFINRNAVRLRDIVDLLSGTGLGHGSYAIVSQGQIDAILSSKPTERRGLFEETAGIGRFLARKAEALRRLEQTEQNAIRVSDLIAELERRIPELDNQVRRARRFRRVSERVRELEILSYLRASATRRAERERVRAQLDEIDARKTEAAARAATLGAQLAQTRYELYRRELELEEKRAAAQTARSELAKLESDAAAALARREALEAQASATIADHERTIAERERIERMLCELDGRIAPLEERIEDARAAELEASAAVAAARSRLDRLFTELRAVEAAAAQRAASEAERRAQIEGGRAHVARTRNAIARDEDEIARTTAVVEERRARFGDLEAATIAAESEAAACAQALEESEARVARAAERVAELGEQVRELSNELAGAQSRLHTLEELEASLEGHVPGTRAIIERRAAVPGVVEVVSNLIDIDERYARALDAALGSNLSSIVVERAADAEAAIALLRSQELGRATFLPLDSLADRATEPSERLADRPGVIGYASDLVRTDPRYRAIVAFLLGEVLVVETFAIAMQLLREGFRRSIVTLDGDLILDGGAIIGGSDRHDASILVRRAQAHHLRESVAKLRADVASAQRALEEAQAESEAAIAAREENRRAHARAAAAQAENRTQLAALAVEIERYDATLQVARERVAALRAELADAQARLSVLERSAVAEVEDDEERERLESELEAARTAIAEREAEHAEAATHAGRLREQHAALVAEREGNAKRLELLGADAERAGAARAAMLEEIEQLRAAGRESDRAIAEAKELVAALDRRVEDIRARREELNARAAQLEADEKLARAQEREANDAGEGARTRLAEIEAELGMLQSAFAQNPASDQECSEVLGRYEGEPDAVVDELPRLREELARLSVNVNLNAEADREELVERERTLREQMDDLTRARETLIASIKEIETETQAQFNQTFSAVAEAFKEMFAQLFPGGEARMWQTDPENIAETGIEIAVAPPGKKMMALSALSGGERAMTAAALIFALIRVKPSPFYLLDEVDAALDDANVERFSEMVRELSDQAQILIVTHNKKTMELAQRMYGVTMREPGVSSIISAALDEFPSDGVVKPSEAALAR
jgi:chromosome segregation protein